MMAESRALIRLWLTYPDDKLVVAVLANLNGPAGQIAGNLAKVAHGEKVVLPTEGKRSRYRRKF